MQTLLFLWIALINNVKFFPLILWLSMPIDEGAQPFWEGEASLGISEIGAFLHFHAFHPRKCALHNEFQRAAISYLRSPVIEAYLANWHANGMSGWWGAVFSGQVDKWTSGQQPLNEKLGHYHHWPRLLPCAFCIIQTMGLWAQILGHHTNTPFAKPFSHIHYSQTTTIQAHIQVS